jgi:outer membrane protein
MTAYRTIAVQVNNRAAADEALSLATERYRVGSGSIIELLDARVTSEQAGVTYINAVYDYHKAIAALEQAVGLPLR